MYYTRILLSVVCCFAFVGCGGGAKDAPDTAPVTGKVVDGSKPVANATVTFQPEDGRPSTATTDETGSFTLEYAEGKLGAKIGTHKVTITIGGAPANSEEEGDGTEGSEEKSSAGTAEPVEHQIKDPAVVKEEGENTFTFDLSKQ